MAEAPPTPGPGPTDAGGPSQSPVAHLVQSVLGVLRQRDFLWQEAHWWRPESSATGDDALPPASLTPAAVVADVLEAAHTAGVLILRRLPDPVGRWSPDPRPAPGQGYRQRHGEVVAARQWWRNGDHPDDGPTYREGAVVRYYRHPEVPGSQVCTECGAVMHDHGWIDQGDDGHTVCPGDWVVTTLAGWHYPVRPAEFAALYEPVSVPDHG
ncbi:MAG: hypothetical protein ACRDYV_02380 [Acidimicrobiia bacterium]